MKTIEYALCYGTSLQEARHLTDEEKARHNPEYRETILIGTGNMIDLKEINWQDLHDLKGRKQYRFKGCGNTAYEITDEEWDAFLALNQARAEARTAKELQEKIEACEAYIAKAEAQKDIPTEEEAKKRIRDYNNLYNEGGEGWVPTIITITQYNNAKSQLESLKLQRDSARKDG